MLSFEVSELRLGASPGPGGYTYEQHRRFALGSCSVCCLLVVAPPSRRTCGKVELSTRFNDFAAGSWTQLHRNAELDTPSPSRKYTTMTIQEKGRAAEQRVRMGEVSRARQCLTGAAVAPGNDTTFQDMQRKRPQIPVAPLPEEVLNFQLDVPVHLDRKTFLSSLKSAPRGSSPGPGGWTYEHLKGMLDDTDTFEWFLSACDSLSQARVPSETAKALMGARMTVLTKPDGGVRGNRGFSKASCGKNTREAVQQSVRDRVCPSSTFCPQGRGRIASGTCCVQQRTQNQLRPS